MMLSDTNTPQAKLPVNPTDGSPADDEAAAVFLAKRFGVVVIPASVRDSRIPSSTCWQG